jgi:hypothetical protein
MSDLDPLWAKLVEDHPYYRVNIKVPNGPTVGFSIHRDTPPREALLDVIETHYAYAKGKTSPAVFFDAHTRLANFKTFIRRYIPEKIKHIKKRIGILIDNRKARVGAEKFRDGVLHQAALQTLITDEDAQYIRNNLKF